MNLRDWLKLQKGIESLEKELAIVGKICKYCRYSGKDIDHPGICRKLNKIPSHPKDTNCSWFDYWNAKDLVTLLTAEEDERKKEANREKRRAIARILEGQRRARMKKPGDDDPEDLLTIEMEAEDTPPGEVQELVKMLTGEVTEQEEK